jgi:hypothetical protein
LRDLIIAPGEGDRASDLASLDGGLDMRASAFQSGTRQTDGFRGR